LISARPSFQLGAIERQHPGAVLGQQQPGDGAGDLGLIDREGAEKSLQTDVVRADLRPRREHRREPREVHRAHLQQRQDEAGEELQARAMPVQMGAEHPTECLD